MQTYTPGDECAICKGKCCKERGCALSPIDLEKRLQNITKESLLEYLQSSDCKFAIDMTQTREGTFYYLRMRTKCYTFIGLEGFGECICLSDEGCILSFDDRPVGGKCLKSSPDFHCKQEYTAQDMQNEWLKYQNILNEIWNEYADILEHDGTMEKCDKEYYEYMKLLKIKERNS